ncbi:MAG: hypothetical protein IKT67_07350 [Lachnospiraceae bacterium]|nr:hypothetical protein [Lachnospiraceae bacterium]
MRDAGREFYHGKEENEREICTMKIKKGIMYHGKMKNRCWADTMKNRGFVLLMVLCDSWTDDNMNR